MRQEDRGDSVTPDILAPYIEITANHSDREEPTILYNGVIYKQYQTPINNVASVGNTKRRKIEFIL